MSMGSDPTLYDGRLSDGQTAAAIAVRARFGEAGLEILPAGERRTALVWPYGDLRSNVPLIAGAPDVVLSLKPNGSQTLFVANPAFSRGIAGAGRAACRRHASACSVCGRASQPSRSWQRRRQRAVPRAAPGADHRPHAAAADARGHGAQRRCPAHRPHEAVRKRARPHRARPPHPAAHVGGIRQSRTRAGPDGRLGPRQRLRHARRADHHDARAGAEGCVPRRSGRRAGP